MSGSEDGGELEEPRGEVGLFGPASLQLQPVACLTPPTPLAATAAAAEDVNAVN